MSTKITIPTNRRLFAILHKTGQVENRANIIQEFTKGRTDTASELTEQEAKELCLKLNKPGTNQKPPAHQRMGKKIIALLAGFGWTKGDKPDYDRINGFIQHIGSNNPEKKTLWNLSYQEIQAVLNQVETMVKHARK